MPVVRCSVNGEEGWKWGEEGKCYPGENGKQKAEIQGRAISMNKKMLFTDNVKITLDGSKMAISVRDGVQEYAGIELGLEPYDKSFKVYRNPDTIRAIKDKLIGIPVTNGHVELEDIPPEKIIGFIDGSELVKYRNELLSSTIAIKNKVKLSDNMIQLLNSKNQLSLGYFAETENHDSYDFEQVNIIPHHLAIVENGRCGTVCKFRDERKDMDPNELDNQEGTETTEEVVTTEEEVKDAEMPVNLQRIAEVVNDLPEAVKLMSLTELEKLVPALELAINTARAATPNGQTALEGTESEEGMEEINDEAETITKTDEPAKADFKDSKAFKDAVMVVADQRVDVILKAKKFLDEGYDFKKDTLTMMRDVLATQTKEVFKDEEVGVAFKMLKKFADYARFADSKGECEIDKLKEKEI
jgi:hypothetical protein